NEDGFRTSQTNGVRSRNHRKVRNNYLFIPTNTKCGQCREQRNGPITQQRRVFTTYVRCDHSSKISRLPEFRNPTSRRQVISDRVGFLFTYAWCHLMNESSFVNLSHG